MDNNGDEADVDDNSVCGTTGGANSSVGMDRYVDTMACNCCTTLPE